MLCGNTLACLAGCGTAYGSTAWLAGAARGSAGSAGGDRPVTSAGCPRPAWLALAVASILAWAAFACPTTHTCVKKPEDTRKQECRPVLPLYFSLSPNNYGAIESSTRLAAPMHPCYPSFYYRCMILGSTGVTLIGRVLPGGVRARCGRGGWCLNGVVRVVIGLRDVTTRSVPRSW
jgi:hypothetical protein